MKKETLTPEEKEARREEKIHRHYRRMYRIFAPFVRFILHLRITGAENIPAEGGCMLCPNHVGAADVLAVAAASRRQVRFLAKNELFRIPLVGGTIRRLGACPIDRGGRDVGALRATIALADRGEVVSVFPQGHRFAGQNPADTPIKYGAGMIACRAGVPVVPVCIRMKKQRYALFRRVDILIGAPILPEEFASGGRDAYRAATELIFARVCELGGFQPSALPAPRNESGEEAAE